MFALAGLLAAALLLSCTKESAETFPEAGPSTVTMSFDASFSPETKSVLQENGDIFWSSSDQIMVINRWSASYDYEPKAAVFTSTNTSDSATARFTADVPEGFTYTAGVGYIAVYPASAVPEQKWDRYEASFVVPGQQKAVPGSFDKDSFISYAVSNSQGAFHFKNVCGGFRFRLTQKGIRSVTFRSPGGGVLCGPARVRVNGNINLISTEEERNHVVLTAPDGESLQPGVWYYISMLPCGLEQGYQLIFKRTDGKVAVKSSTVSRAIKSSVWASLDGADQGVAFEEYPDNEIQYTTSDGKPLIPHTVDSVWDGEYTVLSNYCVDGVWHMVFDKKLESLGMKIFEGCETLTSVRLPDSISHLGQGVLAGCTNLTDVHLPEHLETLDGFEFEGCTSLAEISLPGSLKNIGGFSFWDTGLTHVTIGENVESIGVSAFRMSPLTRVDVLAVRPPEGDVTMFGDAAEALFPIYVPFEGADDYAAANYWCEYSLFTPDGKEVVPVIYTSTDYSHDGEVTLLQKATLGKGVRIVIMGDGFTDLETGPGSYFEEYAKEAMEALFSREPLTSLRNRFDVYAINVVSPRNYFYSKYSDRTLTDESGISITEKSDLMDEYAAKAPNPHGQPTHIILIFNDAKTGTMNARAYCRQKFNTGESVSIMFINHEDAHGESFAQTLLHECAGHGLGYLADEYIEIDYPGLTPDDLANFDARWYNDGLWPNLDWRSDPSEVRWSHFISDERYKDEKIGVFSGGWYVQLNRPNDCSIMNIGFLPEGGDSFNAPGREAIYKRVMKQSEGESWVYDYETFVAFDAPGHEYAVWAFRYCASPEQ